MLISYLIIFIFVYIGTKNVGRAIKITEGPGKTSDVSWLSELVERQKFDAVQYN